MAGLEEGGWWRVGGPVCEACQEVVGHWGGGKGGGELQTVVKRLA